MRLHVGTSLPGPEQLLVDRALLPITGTPEERPVPEARERLG
jgi:hypothetical protein